MMNKAVEMGVFSGINLTNGDLVLSHFLFVDDAIILGKWSGNNFQNLIRLLRCFYLVSGLEINPKKCSLIGMNVNDEHIGCCFNELQSRINSLRLSSFKGWC